LKGERHDFSKVPARIEFVKLHRATPGCGLSCAAMASRFARILFVFLAGWGSGWACSAPGDAGQRDAGADSASGSEGIVGAFAVNLIAAEPVSGTPAYSTLLGGIYDRQQPAALAWTVLASANGCAVRKPRAPFCDPGCGTDVCTDEGCKPQAKLIAVDAVRAQGLGAGEIVMEPINGSYQLPVDVELPNPPCAEGAEVRLESSGPAHPFVVTGKGISPLSLSGTGAIALDPKQPLALAWAPPGDTAIARVRVRIDLSHHGGLKGDIECDVPDTGTLEIPATLIERLVGLGFSGFPSVVVTRSSTGVVTLSGGRVSLVLSSSVERAVTIPGLVSCDDAHPCPTGQTCQIDRRCQ
jgi:hypothetical protein